MKKIATKLLSLFSVLLLCAAICVSFFCLSFPDAVNAAWDGSIAASFASGSGTESNPYLIKTTAQMGYFLNQYASGITYEGLHIRLENSLDMTGATWSYSHGTAFEGTFNGNGYTITADCPLFDDIGVNGTLKGLNYTTIQTQVDRSLLCDYNKGTIDSCVCYGDVYLYTSSNSESGVICTKNTGTVKNSGAIGNIEVQGKDNSAYAAMIRSNSGTVSNCFSALTVYANGSGKYSEEKYDPLVLGTSTGCYYNSDLYTKTAQSGVGLTTAQMKSDAFLASLMGTSVPGTNWVTGPHGYPALAHCSTDYAYADGYQNEKNIVYFSSGKTLTLRSTNSSATVYYTLDGSDPTSSSTRKSVKSGGTVSVSGDAVLTVVPYYNSTYGTISRLDITSLPGSGTASAPYQITTKKQLKAIGLYPDKYFKLLNNITFTESDFTFGGVMAGGWVPVEEFSGTLDGNEYAISGLQGKNGGLFLTNNGTVTSLRLLDHKLYKYGDYGAIAEDNRGTITRCYVRSAFTVDSLPPSATSGAEQVGGIAAYNRGTISYCRNDGVTVFTGGRRYCTMNYIGGICGYNSGTLTNCVNTGVVVLQTYQHTDNGYVGGIVGRGYADNCFSDTDFIIYQSFDYNVKVGGISGNDSYHGAGAYECIAATPSVSVQVSGSYISPTTYKYTFAESYNNCYYLNETRIPSDCPKLDFDSGWMLTGSGLMPQGVMDANGHCFVPNGSATDPTCSAGGSAPVKCTICGKTENQAVSKLGHSEITDAAVAADCENPGLTEGKHCGRCGEVITAQAAVPALGHSFTNYVSDHNATCTADGTKTAKCDNCDEKDTVADPDSKLGHNYVNHICDLCGGNDYVATGTCGENLTWTLDADGLLIVSGTGKMYDYLDEKAPWYQYRDLIQSVLIKDGITSIGHLAFDGCQNLLQISIADSVASIGAGSFIDCINLTNISISKHVTQIFEYAFVGCLRLNGIWVDESNPYYANDSYGVLYNKQYTRLITAPSDAIHGNYVIPESVDYIDSYAFTACTNLTRISIPDKITTIGIFCFIDCKSLINIDIPASVTSIDEKAFSGCDNLTVVFFRGTENQRNGIYLGEENDALIAADWHYEVKDTTFDGKSAYICGKCCGVYSLDGTKVGVYHTYDSVVTAPTCTMEGFTTFTCKCGDTFVSDKTDALGHSFEVCAGMDPTCTTDGWEEYACIVCWDSSVTYREPVPALGHDYKNHICSNCGNTDPIYENKCGDDVYWKIDSFGVLSIYGSGNMYDFLETYAPWNDCRQDIKTVIIEEGVTSIGECAFAQCTKITSVNIPEGMVAIGAFAFSGTAITEVSIPASVTTIHRSAFGYFREAMGGWGFANCDQLRKIIVDPDNTKFASDSSGVLYSKDMSELIRCPGGFGGSYSIPEGTTTIGDGAFNCCKNLTAINSPNSVISIGSDVFTGCESIEYVILPTQLRHIPDALFANCSKLKEVAIPGSIQSIGAYAFYECVNLEKVIFCGTEDQWNSFDYDPSNTSLNDEIVQFHNYSDHICIYCNVSICSVSGHSEITDKGKDATCTATGLTDGSHCDRCGKTLTAQEEIPALGHTWNDGVVTREPTEEETGLRLFTCTVCGETRTETIPELTHTHKYTSTVTDPTCTEAGYTTYTCKCGDSYTESGEPALGHKEVTDKGYAATCTEPGLTDGSHCDRCGKVLTAQTEIPALGHKEVTDKGYTATCTEPGLTDGTHCDRCGKTLTAQEEIPALGHTWNDGVVTREPTEEETGIRTFTCTVCGETRNETIPTLDHEHVYSSAVTDPTCTENGYITYTCACGYSYTEEGQPATGHTEILQPAVAPTCTESGLTDGSYCNVCHATLKEQEVVAALGHEEVTDKGYAATCTEPGLTDGTHCNRCGTVLTGQDEIPALGHMWDSGVVTREPTEEETGVRTFTCSVCQETRTEEIPCLDPAEAEVNRIFGAGRVETAIEVAEQLRSVLGVEQFNAIILANGDNFADALAGSYLAARKDAPILLHRNSGAGDDLNEAYIQNRLAKDGTVYLLGGNAAIPASIEENLRAMGYSVVRLAGDTRFDTNLKILEEAGIGAGDEILITTAWEFADCLSASATGRPILMVNTVTGKLTDSQKAFLAKYADNPFTIIGGTAAVSRGLENDLTAIVGSTERIYGNSREETSVAIAERYFRDPDCVLIAYSRNFPDGLCGGPLANAMNAPLLLINSKKEAPAAGYVDENGITKGIVLGGTAAVSDASVEIIFAE